MAGLTCAYYLRKSGRSVYLVEASDRVGGRLQTDSYAGYRLDRGFQVLLTSYPEARLVLNYDRLNLHELYPGATCLLYTSPSPRDATLSRMPSSA